jgi:hypothetical protein
MGSIRAHRRREIETEYGLPLRLILLDLYYRRRLDQAAIGRQLGVPEGTVASWFLRFGIQPATLAALKAVEMLDAEEACTA